MAKIKELRDIDLEQIYEFIEGGITQTIPEEVADYLEAMDKVRGMHLRIDKFGSKDAIVNHLIKVDGLSRYLADKLYNQAIEYFYAEQTISKAAWRNVAAEMLMKVINFAIHKMKDTTDAAKVSKMFVDFAKLRQLDLPDKEELDDKLFERPFKVYTADGEMLGLPPVDRKKVAEFIDGLEDLSESQKILIKREAQILPLKAFLDDSENPRKNEV